MSRLWGYHVSGLPQTPRQRAASRRNFARRPEKPALNAGKIQKAVVGLYVGLDARVISARLAANEVYYQERLLAGGGKLKPGHYQRLTRAFQRIAKPVGREAKGSGRSMLWELTVDLNDWPEV